jgi:Fic/DOC family protein
MWAAVASVVRGTFRVPALDRSQPLFLSRRRLRPESVVDEEWLADQAATRYSEDELAVGLGYRLVVVHPFGNGNGRWSRLAADALVVALGGARFTRGGVPLAGPGPLRCGYIAALQAADTEGHLQPLAEFARR